MHKTLEKTSPLKQTRLQPLLKWPGGKERELKNIAEYLPDYINRYFEPFIGGGAVYFAMNANEYFINDKMTDLTTLYQNIKFKNADFFNALLHFDNSWISLSKFVEDNFEKLERLYKNYKQMGNTKEFKQELFINNQDFFKALITPCFSYDIKKYDKTMQKIFFDKIARINKLEQEKGELSREDISKNLESALKAGLYTYLRALFNSTNKLNIKEETYNVLFLFLRNYAYSSMFRYNANGEFNVPYGGIEYNRKFLTKKLDYYNSDELKSHLSITTICNLDFEEFLELNQPQSDDFVFLDPPYDTTFSTYAQNSFDKLDQERLANYFINKCKAKWMLVIKNTEFIYDLYNKPGINIQSFDKKYTVSFKNRNDKSAKHLIIMNY